MHYIPCKRLAGLAVLSAVLATAALAPLPALSADTGAVNAQVVAGAAPCITITSPSNNAAVSFGNLAFSTTPGSSQGSGSPDITIASCATGSESLLGAGTNATGTNASWTLVAANPNTCTNNLNQYRLALRDANQTDVFLTTQNQSVGTLAANAALTRTRG